MRHDLRHAVGLTPCFRLLHGRFIGYLDWIASEDTFNWKSEITVWPIAMPRASSE